MASGLRAESQLWDACHQNEVLELLLDDSVPRLCLLDFSVIRHDLDAI